ncbi:MAG: tRNA pseudouridine(55) synthase TruB [Casimicrobiaceae bacterium]
MAASGGRSRPPRRRVDGVLLLDKPAGLSSNAALQRAKHLYAAEKAGHTGTLDPLATGLLPLCFGDATKFAQTLLDAPKEYVATVRFGVKTTTGDAEGEPVRTCGVAFSRAELESALTRFVGPTVQIPPAFAALKFRGRNYYEYARAGVDIPRVPRPIEIAAIELIDWAPPIAVLRIASGKGTYIRVLAEDIAAALSSCAHLGALRRTVSGPFSLAGAVTMEALQALDGPARDSLLLPSDAPLSGVARLDVDAPTALALAQGKAGTAPVEAEGTFRCYGPMGRFVGLVEAEGGALRSLRLARTDAPSGKALES